MNQSSAGLVLLVDDEERFRDIFSAKLTQEGFQVETAKDGADAVEKVKQFMPDLVLMDMKMPGMDGVDTMLKLKENWAPKSLKVIFLTSAGEPDPHLAGGVDEKFSKEIGAFGFVRKTDDLDVIVSKIKEALAK